MEIFNPIMRKYALVALTLIKKKKRSYIDLSFQVKFDSVGITQRQIQGISSNRSIRTIYLRKSRNATGFFFSTNFTQCYLHLIINYFLLLGFV